VLSTTQLVGFGAGGGGGGVAYRRFRMNITATPSGNYIGISELWILVGTTEYPTSDMTAPALPEPQVAAASSDTNGAAWLAFSSVTLNRWVSGNVGGVAWISIDLGADNEIVADGYTIKGNDTATRTPSAWTLEGSNATSSPFTGEEDTLDTRTGVSWTANQERTYTPLVP
jgi:hypothetical protein